ncbi:MULTISPECIES: tyrosine-type recombinase/integrase [Sphingobium]|uniref:Tyrosine-type recombinase/integrase n=2 Tax=Sphingobium TaxID=165695 RepID=A0A9X7UCU7_SPHYA|nr:MULTISPECIES: integrase arm-type DNA-binding domain-containing protein [Sphingobium]MDV5824532.1 tyrosine-type recombinase/integrase [Sphingobium naphthae]QNG47928.1 tyrosine-type recombinase/integrase [Sphingobium yanoikuyae]
MLTYIQINAAKPREKAWNLSDSQGLYLVIQPNGSKLWRFNYRFLDKQKKLHLGGWPTTSLADARVRRDEAKKKIAEGIDPALEKKRARIAAKYAAANTFEAVAEEWLVKCERDGLAPVTVDKIRWLLAKAYPVIGSIPIAQITPHEALAVLRKVEATGAFESARRMRSVLSRVFRYGVATVRCDKDVAADLRGAIASPKVKHFAAITKPSEVGALLRAIDGYSGHKVTVMALRLSPHVLLRPGELRQAEWADIDFEEAIWFIPAERMKMRRPHRVPLSRQVIDMLQELHEHTHWWKYLFPCLGKPRKPMSENAVNQGLRNLGYTSDQMTAHGFRAMAATLLNERGEWNPDAIERQLAHVDTNQVRRAYARGEYWDERVQMMQSWSDYLDELRDGGKILRPTFPTARRAV